mmetsp:Transcript_363/g.926  ORF Transcript_363/g.926 Transcript_363/m.926 type:complete len:96 (+) Transcript_363:3-290(+)
MKGEEKEGSPSKEDEKKKNRRKTTASVSKQIGPPVTPEPKSTPSSVRKRNSSSPLESSGRATKRMNKQKDIVKSHQTIKTLFSKIQLKRITAEAK